MAETKTGPFHIYNASQADVWFYWSASGKSLEFFVRPLDDCGDPILSAPVQFRLPIKKVEAALDAVRGKK